jgi:hypothetical protein
MRAVIVVLGLPSKTPQPVANRFAQKFYGQNALTRGGSYRYRKVGLLDGIPHRKLRPGVVVVNEGDLPKVEGFLQTWNVEYEVRVIRPLPLDRKALSLTPR